MATTNYTSPRMQQDRAERRAEQTSTSIVWIVLAILAIAAIVFAVTSLSGPGNPASRADMAAGTAPVTMMSQPAATDTATSGPAPTQPVPSLLRRNNRYKAR
jgi:hypothetical protein